MVEFIPIFRTFFVCICLLLLCALPYKYISIICMIFADNLTNLIADQEINIARLTEELSVRRLRSQYNTNATNKLQRHNLYWIPEGNWYFVYLGNLAIKNNSYTFTILQSSFRVICILSYCIVCVHARTHAGTRTHVRTHNAITHLHVIQKNNCKIVKVWYVCVKLFVCSALYILKLYILYCCRYSLKEFLFALSNTTKLPEENFSLFRNEYYHILNIIY